MSVFKNQCFPPLKYKLDLLVLGLAICLLKARNVPLKQNSAEPLWAVPTPSLSSCTEGPKQPFFFFKKKLTGLTRSPQDFYKKETRPGCHPFANGISTDVK